MATTSLPVSAALRRLPSRSEDCNSVVVVDAVPPRPPVLRHSISDRASTGSEGRLCHPGMSRLAAQDMEHVVVTAVVTAETAVLKV